MNQRETTLRCLAALKASSQAAFAVLVWDNGSEDGTITAVREKYPDVMVHHYPANLGVASGRNEAARMAVERFQPTHFLFLDNDMLVEPGFVEALREPFGDDTRVAQTQAKLRFTHEPTKLNDGGGANINFLRWQITPVGYGETDRGQYDRVAPCTCCGGAMMVRADVFRELGGFDALFDPFGPEDLDFSLRLQRAGYLALYVPKAVAYHAVSHTYGYGYTASYARHKVRHWVTFMQRHATPRQKVGFVLFGAPVTVARLLLREGRRGNFGALFGLLRGAVDILKAAPVHRRERG